MGRTKAGYRRRGCHGAQYDCVVLFGDWTMRSTQPLSVTLPNEMAEAVKAKVARGEYASESEVVREGLRALMERDRAIEAWLREQVVPAARELERDPTRGLTPAQVREHLAQIRRTRARTNKA